MAWESSSTLGQPVRRREDARLLAGRGVFLDDIRLPDTLHMAFVRSPTPTPAHSVGGRLLC